MLKSSIHWIYLQFFPYFLSLSIVIQKSRTYLSPEFCVDVVCCQFCNWPQLRHRAQITGSHHQADDTVPGTRQRKSRSAQHGICVPVRGARASGTSRPGPGELSPHGGDAAAPSADRTGSAAATVTAPATPRPAPSGQMLLPPRDPGETKSDVTAAPAGRLHSPRPASRCRGISEIWDGRKL